MDTVKAAPVIEPRTLAEHFAAVARAGGFHADNFGWVRGYRLLALTKPAPAGGRPAVYLSAGIHGDEPASPLALLRLLEAGTFDARANWYLCPLLNPTGLAAGTRDNAEGVDLNRDYRHGATVEVAAHIAWLRQQPAFALTLCLHEDWEAKGFYLYELNPENRPSLAGAMIGAAAGIGPIDPSAVIDGRPAAGGIIRPPDDPAGRERWPEAIYLRAHHTTLSYTLESASSLPLEKRVAALSRAAETGLRQALG
ncbi:MAG TPA: M14 family metallocarboxypeptidase [Opitutaceae bacterium]|nr:M14 family metallocarboxypeptidase [Opitutaceae bacterium]